MATSRTVTIVNQRGLHARASAKLAGLAGCFDETITVSKAGESVVATSIMGLMMLGAAKGEEITITVDGSSGEEAVLIALCDLVTERFGEDE